MNCARCGQAVPQGAAVCPACGEPAAQPQAQQPYVVQPAYQQSYAQYQQGSYPPGYQQPYTYGQPLVREENSFLSTLSDLPRAFADSFSRPGEVLRSMMEKRDRFSFPIVAALALLLTFLCGMVLMRGFVGVLFDLLGAVTGVSMAGNAASMNQGVSYIAGRVAPSVGGIAVLGQFISMAVPAVVFMVYICVLCKVTFSWSLLSGFVTVTTLPTVAAGLLAMALSLLSPWLGLVPVVCGAAISYTQACSMLGLITTRPDGQLVRAKIICTALALALTLLLCGLAGGLLMGGVMQRMYVLLSSVGSLI